jgi:DNA-binding IclR family transcriptional regulator
MLLTIDSAGRVLSMFTSDSPEHGATEVALAIGVSKSKAHALLTSLSSVGLLRRTGRGRYRVGWRVLSLTRVLAETTDFHRHARPVMESLGQQLGELVELAALDDGKVVYIDRTRGARASAVAAHDLGIGRHSHGAAVGKILLANLSSGELDHMLERHGLPAVTARTQRAADLLRGELEQARRRGFAVDRGEELDRMSSVAAPILAPGRVVVAAIGVVSESTRFEEREALYRQAVIRAAKYISQRLTDAERRAMAGSKDVNARAFTGASA